MEETLADWKYLYLLSSLSFWYSGNKQIAQPSHFFISFVKGFSCTANLLLTLCYFLSYLLIQKPFF